jgi:septum formation protein
MSEQAAIGPRVVLASSSPRRRELLTLIGIPHTVRAADIDETPHASELPRAHAERLAREKTTTVADGDRDAVVIGADTIVVVDGDILGKPRDQREAAIMLRRLSGRTHVVLTAVAVARHGRLVSGVESVDVTFRRLSDEDVTRYIATREPMDKAGAYGIQGFGATIVERVDGDYFAVMGLALGLMVRLMAQIGVEYRFGPVTESAQAVHNAPATAPPSP